MFTPSCALAWCESVLTSGSEHFLWCLSLFKKSFSLLLPFRLGVNEPLITVQIIINFWSLALLLLYWQQVSCFWAEIRVIIQSVIVTQIYVTVCLCWRCTRVGTTSDPDVVLLCWAFWVQGDLILFITGAGSARWCLWVAVLAPLVLWPLWVANALVRN